MDGAFPVPVMLKENNAAVIEHFGLKSHRLIHYTILYRSFL